MKHETENSLGNRSVSPLLHPSLPDLLCSVHSLASVNVFGTLMIPKLVGEAVDQMLGTGQVFYEGLFAIPWQIALLHPWQRLRSGLWTLAITRWRTRLCVTFVETRLKKSRHYQFSYLDIHPAGEIESRIIADADQFADGLLMGFTSYLPVMTILNLILYA